MAIVDVYVPLIMNRGYGFFGEGVPEARLFGYRVTMVGAAPAVGQTEAIQGLCFHGLEEENVEELVTRVRRLLLWASIALNKTIRTDDAAPQRRDSGAYDGRTTYYYPAGLALQPTTAWGSVYGAEPYSKLIDVVAESDRRAAESLAACRARDIARSDDCSSLPTTTLMRPLWLWGAGGFQVVGDRNGRLPSAPRMSAFRGNAEIFCSIRVLRLMTQSRLRQP
jgi:hypothetical protein